MRAGDLGAEAEGTAGEAVPSLANAQNTSAEPVSGSDQHQPPVQIAKPIHSDEAGLKQRQQVKPAKHHQD